MTHGEREQRLAFLGLTPHDAGLLQALRPVLEQHGNTVVDAFYEHLLKFPATAELLRDPTIIARIKQAQRAYLLRITEGNFDEAYFADRLRIGQTHERVGLTSRWYLLEYSLLFNLLTPLIRQQSGGDVNRADATMAEIGRAHV